MALRGARSIKIDDHVYKYLLSGGKSRFTGQSGKLLTLTIESPSGARLQHVFESKLWKDSDDHEYVHHQNSFTPKCVEAVIRSGNLPQNFEIGTWRLHERD